MSYNAFIDFNKDRYSNTTNSVVQTIESEPHPYRLPVFKLESKDIRFNNETKHVSRVRLINCDFMPKYYNVSLNNNTLRWLRKVKLSLNENVTSIFPGQLTPLNPYFDVNAPNEEWHLCTLYINPGYYESVEDIITELNNSIKQSVSSLFNVTTRKEILYNDVALKDDNYLFNTSGVLAATNSILDASTLVNDNAHTSYIIDNYFLYTNKNGDKQEITDGIVRFNTLDNIKLTTLKIINPEFSNNHFNISESDGKSYIRDSTLSYSTHKSNLIYNMNLNDITCNFDLYRNPNGVHNIDFDINDSAFHPVRYSDSTLINSAVLKTFPEYIGLMDTKDNQVFYETNFVYRPYSNQGYTNDDLHFDLDLKLTVDADQTGTFSVIDSGSIRAFSVNYKTAGYRTFVAPIDFTGRILSDSYFTKSETIPKIRLYYNDNSSESSIYPYYYLYCNKDYDTDSSASTNSYVIDQYKGSGTGVLQTVLTCFMTDVDAYVYFDGSLESDLRDYSCTIESGKIKSMLLKYDDTEIDNTSKAKLYGFTLKSLQNTNIGLSESSTFDTVETRIDIPTLTETDKGDLTPFFEENQNNMLTVYKSTIQKCDKYGIIKPELCSVYPDGSSSTEYYYKIIDMESRQVFIYSNNQRITEMKHNNNSLLAFVMCKSGELDISTEGNGIKVNTYTLHTITEQGITSTTNSGYILRLSDHSYVNVEAMYIITSSSVSGSFECASVVIKPNMLLNNPELYRQNEVITTKAVISNSSYRYLNNLVDFTSTTISDKDDANFTYLKRKAASNMYGRAGSSNVFTPIDTEQFNYTSTYAMKMKDIAFLPFGTFKPMSSILCNVNTVDSSDSPSEEEKNVNSTYIFCDIVDENVTLTFNKSNTFAMTQKETTQNERIDLFTPITEPVTNADGSVSYYTASLMDKDVHEPLVGSMFQFDDGSIKYCTINYSVNNDTITGDDGSGYTIGIKGLETKLVIYGVTSTTRTKTTDIHLANVYNLQDNIFVYFNNSKLYTKSVTTNNSFIYTEDENGDHIKINTFAYPNLYVKYDTNKLYSETLNVEVITSESIPHCSNVDMSTGLYKNTSIRTSCCSYPCSFIFAPSSKPERNDYTTFSSLTDCCYNIVFKKSTEVREHSTYSLVNNLYIANVNVSGSSSKTQTEFDFNVNMVLEYEGTDLLTSLFENANEKAINNIDGLHFILNGISINSMFLFRRDNFMTNVSLGTFNDHDLIIRDYISEESIKDSVDPSTLAGIATCDNNIAIFDQSHTTPIHKSNIYTNTSTQKYEYPYLDIDLDTTDMTFSFGADGFNANVDKNSFPSCLLNGPLMYDNTTSTTLVSFDYSHYRKKSADSAIYPSYYMNGARYSIFSPSEDGDERNYSYFPISDDYVDNTNKAVEYIDSSLMDEDTYTHAYYDQDSTGNITLSSDGVYLNDTISKAINAYVYKYNSKQNNEPVDSCLYFNKLESQNVRIAPMLNVEESFIPTSWFQSHNSIITETDNNIYCNTFIIFKRMHSYTDASMSDYKCYIYSRNTTEVKENMKNTCTLSNPISTFINTAMSDFITFTSDNIVEARVYLKESANEIKVYLLALVDGKYYLIVRTMSGRILVDTFSPSGYGSGVTRFNIEVYFENGYDETGNCVSTIDDFIMVKQDRDPNNTTGDNKYGEISITASDTPISVIQNRLDTVKDNYRFPYTEQCYKYSSVKIDNAKHGIKIYRTSYVMKTGDIIAESHLNPNEHKGSNYPFCKVDIKCLRIDPGTIRTGDRVNFKITDGDFRIIQSGDIEPLQLTPINQSYWYIKITPLKKQEAPVKCHRIIPIDSLYKEQELNTKYIYGNYISFNNEAVDIYTNTGDRSVLINYFSPLNVLHSETFDKNNLYVKQYNTSTTSIKYIQNATGNFYKFDPLLIDKDHNAYNITITRTGLMDIKTLNLNSPFIKKTFTTPLGTSVNYYTQERNEHVKLLIRTNANATMIGKEIDTSTLLSLESVTLKRPSDISLAYDEFTYDNGSGNVNVRVFVSLLDESEELTSMTSLFHQLDGSPGAFSMSGGGNDIFMIRDSENGTPLQSTIPISLTFESLTYVDLADTRLTRYIVTTKDSYLLPKDETTLTISYASNSPLTSTYKSYILQNDSTHTQHGKGTIDTFEFFGLYAGIVTNSSVDSGEYLHCCRMRKIVQKFTKDINSLSDEEVYTSLSSIGNTYGEVLSYYMKYDNANFVALNSIKLQGSNVVPIRDNIIPSSAISDKATDLNISGVKFAFSDIRVGYTTRYSYGRDGQIYYEPLPKSIAEDMSNITSCMKIKSATGDLLGIGYTSKDLYNLSGNYSKSVFSTSSQMNNVKYKDDVASSLSLAMDGKFDINAFQYSDDAFMYRSLANGYENVEEYYTKPGFRCYDSASNSMFYNMEETNVSADYSSYLVYTTYKDTIEYRDDIYSIEYKHNSDQRTDDNALKCVSNTRRPKISDVTIDKSIYPTSIVMKLDESIAGQVIEGTGDTVTLVKDGDYYYYDSTQPVYLTEYEQHSSSRPTRVDMTGDTIVLTKYENTPGVWTYGYYKVQMRNTGGTPLINKGFRIALSPGMSAAYPNIFGLNIFDIDVNNPSSKDFSKCTIHYKGNDFTVVMNIEGSGITQPSVPVFYVYMDVLHATKGTLSDGLLERYGGAIGSYNDKYDIKNKIDLSGSTPVESEATTIATNKELLFDDYFNTLYEMNKNEEVFLKSIDMLSSPKIGLEFITNILPITSDIIYTNTGNFTDIVMNPNFYDRSTTLKPSNVMQYSKGTITVSKDPYIMNKYNDVVNNVDDYFYNFTKDGDLWSSLGFNVMLYENDTKYIPNYNFENRYDYVYNTSNVEPIYIIKGKYYSEQLYTGPIIASRNSSFIDKNIDITTDAISISSSSYNIAKGENIKDILNETVIETYFLKKKHYSDNDINLSIPKSIDVKLTQNNDVELHLNTNKMMSSITNIGSFTISDNNGYQNRPARNSIKIDSTVTIPDNGAMYVYLTGSDQRYPLINTDATLNVEYIS